MPLTAIGAHPAILATAEAQGAHAERILTAIAIGYEIGVRVAGARDIEMLHTFDSGLWCRRGRDVVASIAINMTSARLRAGRLAELANLLRGEVQHVEDVINPLEVR